MKVQDGMLHITWPGGGSVFSHVGRADFTRVDAKGQTHQGTVYGRDQVEAEKWAKSSGEAIQGLTSQNVAVRDLSEGEQDDMLQWLEIIANTPERV